MREVMESSNIGRGSRGTFGKTLAVLLISVFVSQVYPYPAVGLDMLGVKLDVPERQRLPQNNTVKGIKTTTTKPATTTTAPSPDAGVPISQIAAEGVKKGGRSLSGKPTPIEPSFPDPSRIIPKGRTVNGIPTPMVDSGTTEATTTQQELETTTTPPAPEETTSNPPQPANTDEPNPSNPITETPASTTEQTTPQSPIETSPIPDTPVPDIPTETVTESPPIVPTTTEIPNEVPIPELPKPEPPPINPMPDLVPKPKAKLPPTPNLKPPPIPKVVDEEPIVEAPPNPIAPPSVQKVPIPKEKKSKQGKDSGKTKIVNNNSPVINVYVQPPNQTQSGGSENSQGQSKPFPKMPMMPKKKTMVLNGVVMQTDYEMSRNDANEQKHSANNNPGNPNNVAGNGDAPNSKNSKVSKKSGTVENLSTGTGDGDAAKAKASKSGNKLPNSNNPFKPGGKQLASDLSARDNDETDADDAMKSKTFESFSDLNPKDSEDGGNESTPNGIKSAKALKLNLKNPPSSRADASSGNFGNGDVASGVLNPKSSLSKKNNPKSNNDSPSSTDPNGAEVSGSSPFKVFKSSNKKMGDDMASLEPSASNGASQSENAGSKSSNRTPLRNSNMPSSGNMGSMQPMSGNYNSNAAQDDNPPNPYATPGGYKAKTSPTKSKSFETDESSGSVRNIETPSGIKLSKADFSRKSSSSKSTVTRNGPAANGEIPNPYASKSGKAGKGAQEGPGTVDSMGNIQSDSFIAPMDTDAAAAKSIINEKKKIRVKVLKNVVPKGYIITSTANSSKITITAISFFRGGSLLSTADDS